MYDNCRTDYRIVMLYLRTSEFNMALNLFVTCMIFACFSRLASVSFGDICRYSKREIFGKKKGTETRGRGNTVGRCSSKIEK